MLGVLWTYCELSRLWASVQACGHQGYPPPLPLPPSSAPLQEAGPNQPALGCVAGSTLPLPGRLQPEFWSVAHWPSCRLSDPPPLPSLFPFLGPPTPYLLSVCPTIQLQRARQTFPTSSGPCDPSLRGPCQRGGEGVTSGPSLPPRRRYGLGGGALSPTPSVTGPPLFPPQHLLPLRWEGHFGGVLLTLCFRADKGGKMKNPQNPLPRHRGEISDILPPSSPPSALSCGAGRGGGLVEEGNGGLEPLKLRCQMSPNPACSPGP